MAYITVQSGIPQRDRGYYNATPQTTAEQHNKIEWELIQQYRLFVITLYTPRGIYICYGSSGIPSQTPYQSDPIK